MFEPLDAFLAAFDKHNYIIVSGLSDPDLVPTILSEFEVNNNYYEGIYHNDLDIWEILDETTGDGYILADKSHEFYDFAEQTALKFRDKLCDGPCPNLYKNKFAKFLAKRLQDDIDRDIICDLLIGINISGTPAEIPIIPTRKLKATWSIEKAKPISNCLAGVSSKMRAPISTVF